MSHLASTPKPAFFGMTFDCNNATAQARFWNLALGYVKSPPPRGWETWEAFLSDHGVPPDEWDDGATICDPGGVLPTISFLKVPEPKQAKNRLHLDLKVSGGRDIDAQERAMRIETKVTELVTAGATIQRRDVENGTLDHVVMLDPEGNEFCIV